jgi:biopolymer transport protein ExbB
MTINETLGGMWETILLGGPVLFLLLITSVASLALFGVKLMQFRAAGVGRHEEMVALLRMHDRGETAQVESQLRGARNYLGQLALLAIRSGNAREARQRLEAEAEQSFLQLERGLRALDIVAQMAPLLGLFGTVLGMIEAFQALQGAGSQVDPSVLAGGIWVALLTTAAGLAVAMPVSIGLAWLESQLDRERAMAERIISAIATPLPSASTPVLASSEGQRVTA